MEKVKPEVKGCYLKAGLCYLIISLHLFFTFFWSGPQLQSSPLQVKVEPRVLIAFIWFFFPRHSPSQDDFRVIGAASKIRANEKDGFSQCSFNTAMMKCRK